MYTTLSISKTFAVQTMDRNNMMITAVGKPMVENILTFMGDQKIGRNDLVCINILFMLKMNICFISGILLAKASSLLSVKPDTFRDCIKLKIFIFEYDILKPNLYSGISVMGSIFSLLLDWRKKFIAFASQPSGR